MSFWSQLCDGAGGDSPPEHHVSVESISPDDVPAEVKDAVAAMLFEQFGGAITMEQARQMAFTGSAAPRPSPPIKHDLVHFVRGHVDIVNEVERYVYRGVIERIAVEGEARDSALVIRFRSLERGDQFPNPKRWLPLSGADLDYSVSLFGAEFLSAEPDRFVEIYFLASAEKIIISMPQPAIIVGKIGRFQAKARRKLQLAAKYQRRVRSGSVRSVGKRKQCRHRSQLHQRQAAVLEAASLT